MQTLAGNKHLRFDPSADSGRFVAILPLQPCGDCSVQGSGPQTDWSIQGSGPQTDWSVQGSGPQTDWSIQGSGPQTDLSVQGLSLIHI